jgi:hypothetical protein
MVRLHRTRDQGRGDLFVRTLVEDEGTVYSGDVDLHASSPAPDAVNPDASAQLCHALANAQKSQPAAPPRTFSVGGIEAHTIVLNDHANLVGITVKAHATGRGPRVPRDVGQRFLDDSVQRALDLGTLPAIEALVDEPEVDLVPPPKVGDMRVDRGHEPQVLQRGWVQQVGQVTHAAQRSIGARLRISQHTLSSVLSLHSARGHSQLHLHGAKRLTDVVVQLARDSALFLLLPLHLPGR